MAKENKVAETHTVHTDALGTIGMIIPENAGRDAIHLAVEPVTSEQILYPGQHIGWIDKDNRIVGDKLSMEKIGIVDPFLVGPVHPGQRFWLVVYPRTITSLRHVWEHPLFPPAITEKIVEVEVIKEVPVISPGDDPAASEAWLRDWCRKSDGPSYERMLELVQNGSVSWGGDDHDYGYSAHIEGEYIYVYGSDASGYIPDEFWDHMEVVTGKRIRNRPEYFSCSC